MRSKSSAGRLLLALVLAVLPGLVTGEEELPPPPVAVADLDALVALGLERSPGIAAVRAQVAGLRSRGRAVVAPPEPLVTVAPLGAMAQTASGEVALMVGVSQRIPGPGKLRARGDEVRAEAGVVETAVAEREVTLARELRAAWWRRAEASAALAIVDDQAALLADLERAVAARIEANRASTAALLRLRLETTTLDAARSRWRERRSVAEAALRSLLSLGETAEIPTLEEDPPPPSGLADPEYLRRLAARSHPALQRSRAETAAAEIQRRSATVRRRPDFTVFANYNVVEDDGRSPVADGEDQWWVGAGVSVPVWFGAYSAGEEAADAMTRRAAWLRREAADRIERQLQTAVAEHAATAERLALYRERLVPQAQEAVAAERAAYASGTGAFADLVMSARQVLALELEASALAHELRRREAAVLAAAGATVLPPEPEGADDE